MKQLSENLYNRSRYRIRLKLEDSLYYKLGKLYLWLPQRFRVRPVVRDEERFV